MTSLAAAVAGVVVVGAATATVLRSRFVGMDVRWLLASLGVPAAVLCAAVIAAASLVRCDDAIAPAPHCTAVNRLHVSLVVFGTGALVQVWSRPQYLSQQRHHSFRLLSPVLLQCCVLCMVRAWKHCCNMIFGCFAQVLLALGYLTLAAGGRSFTALLLAAAEECAALTGKVLYGAWNGGRCDDRR